METIKGHNTHLWNCEDGGFNHWPKLSDTACYVLQSGCVPEQGPHRETRSATIIMERHAEEKACLKSS